MKRQMMMIGLLALCLLGCQQEEAVTFSEYFQQLDERFAPEEGCNGEGETLLIDYDLSPSEEVLVIFTNREIYFYELATAEKTVLADFKDYCVYPPWMDLQFDRRSGGTIAFSTDGEQLALASGYPDQPIMIWDLESLRLEETITDVPNETTITEAKFGPNSEQIIIRSKSTEISQYIGPGCDANYGDILTLHNLESGIKIYQIEWCTTRGFLHFQFSNDEKIAFGRSGMSPPSLLAVFDIRSGKELAYYSRNTVGPEYFLFYPDKGLFYFTLDGSRENFVPVNVVTAEELPVNISQLPLWFKDVNSYIVRASVPEFRAEYWQNGEIKCSYDGLNLIPYPYGLESQGNLIFGSDYRRVPIKVWDIQTCELIVSLPFDGGVR